MIDPTPLLLSNMDHRAKDGFSGMGEIGNRGSSLAPGTVICQPGCLVGLRLTLVQG